MGNDRFDIYATSDQNLSPGEARCPGPSVQEVLKRDCDNPPPALQESRYVYLGNDDIPLSRYTDETFHQTEIIMVQEKLIYL